MDGSGYFSRLAAMAAVAAGLGFAIVQPETGRTAAARVSAKVEAMTPVRASLETQPCARGQAPLSGAFAPIEDIISVSPLGAVTAPGEPLPAPYIRLNTRKGDSLFERRATTARAPARADITAIERRLVSRTDDTGATAYDTVWRVHFAACEDIKFYYDRIDTLDADILRRVGGLAAFSEIGGPHHLAVKTQLRVKTGDPIGAADGFNVGLDDLAAKKVTAARPARYTANPYAHTAVFDLAPEISKAISLDVTHARCPLDYLPADKRTAWTEKLGDAFGLRRASGENACRTALVDIPGTAQGAWFTDASHNAATNKVSAIALAPDAIDPSRLIFALHGRVKSLKAEMVALGPNQADQKEAAAKDFLTFPKGQGRLNTPFALVNDGPVYCYQNLRANFVGPRITGVMLLQIDKTGGAPLMKLEARNDVSSCIDLPQPWAFSGAETSFYR